MAAAGVARTTCNQVMECSGAIGRWSRHASREEEPMAEFSELHTQALPMLPLPTGVVLPSMVVTLALDTPESNAAAEAALAGDGRLLLVPHVNGVYARVGTVAQVDTAGDLPNGTRALILRGLHRAVLGSGVNGAGDASVLWVQAESVSEDDPDDRTRALTREFRGVISAF